MAKETMEKVVRIPDLEKEFGLPGRTIRQVLRKSGLRASETGIEGFGPKARYEWKEGWKELEKVRSILKEFVASKGKRTSRTKQEDELEEDEELEQEETEEDDEEEDD